MSSIPEEIYLEIFLRVPVKSTFVCKCVCKTWFSIISDPDFVKLHLKRTTKTNNYSLTLQSAHGNSFYSTSYDSLSSADAAAVVELDFPYKSQNIEFEIKLFGSCNGLVYGWNYPMRFFFLWNPATKEHKRLPESQPDNCCDTFHGFGYDYKTDDYKLVSVIPYKETAVYSLKSNKWKRFQSIRYGLSYSQPSGVLFNGALHWLRVIDKPSPVMVSMDISEERFGKLQLPMTLPMFYIHVTNMAVLDECICFLVCIGDTFEVWVMQEYGIPESWAKLYTIAYESIMSMHESIYYLELMGSFKNGEIMFKNLHMVILYDPKCGTARKPNIRGLMVGAGVSYFESLVSLKNSTTKKRKR